jgi:alpha/beta superfamily hydrolase
LGVLTATAEAAPKHVAIFFPGADGRIRAARAGASQHGARPSTLGLMAEGFGAAVVMGLASDQARGIALEARASEAHLTDALAVIDHVASRYPDARLTVVGLSAGGFTAARAANAVAARGKPKLNALVVLSSGREAITPTRTAALDAAKLPVLVMHHRRDSCLPFKEMEAAAMRYTFEAVDDPAQPEVSNDTRDCNPGSAHVFAGKEREVYGRFAAWARSVSAPPPADAQHLAPSATAHSR